MAPRKNTDTCWDRIGGYAAKIYEKKWKIYKFLGAVKKFFAEFPPMAIPPRVSKRTENKIPTEPPHENTYKFFGIQK